MTEENDMTHCPYNFAHIVLKSRMPAHLIKCRQQYPAEKFEYCSFNNSHSVPTPELQYHLQSCPDRKELEKYIYVIDEPKVDDQTFQIQLPSSSENWDEEETSGGSFLNVKNKVVEKQLVFRQPVGKSKAERRAFFQNEVVKFGQNNTENFNLSKDKLK